MPFPVVEPSPPPFNESLFADPLDAQDASYFAASERIARRWEREIFIARSYFVPEYEAQEKT
ncbi:hypothetical protein GKA01_17920 [Gluconobacter kanchanaburiensis NBRC 103587]|uniref:Uncharacterized protein n=1 Tax=Gluconobacter kanchanaburiensis NBRC 103587 TaxID=1307948 RepID=A0A511B807_9PROT|nr:hypothetical protein GKA01_17920 [Gluconobacter kanchanaburiensis NBRC 103587]